MQIEGQLKIDIHAQDGRPCRVEIRSSRPLQMTRIFEGKAPEQVLATLPRLYSMCGMAQGVAAIDAFRQVLGREDVAPAVAARALLVMMETAREHLWHIMLGWPGLMEASAEAHSASLVQPLLPGLRQSLFGDGDPFSLTAQVRPNISGVAQKIDSLERIIDEQVFCESAALWRAIDSYAGLGRWADEAETVAARLIRRIVQAGWEGVGASDSKLLPALSAAALTRCLRAADAERFVAEPTWQGQTMETSPLTRQIGQPLIRTLHGEFGNGLLTRFAARLVELAGLAEAMRVMLPRLQESAQTPAADAVVTTGTGIGVVEAARGRLAHRVEMAGPVVRRYQILVPTEWNFHPAGVVARGLAGLPEGDPLVRRRQAEMLVAAVDPCVGYELRVH
ncbi:MAG: nickel-dependent hydrogenase large subunit [Gammaproteobacteria bacterium]|nr:nickel-dependent hydrogenase large subunit [Gammaproteobacteria bacterium]